MSAKIDLQCDREVSVSMLMTEGGHPAPRNQGRASGAEATGEVIKQRARRTKEGDRARRGEFQTLLTA
eukprot:478519-Hanusia_phi.AAC.2